MECVRALFSIFFVVVALLYFNFKALFRLSSYFMGLFFDISPPYGCVCRSNVFSPIFGSAHSQYYISFNLCDTVLNENEQIKSRWVFIDFERKKKKIVVWNQRSMCVGHM